MSGYLKQTVYVILLLSGLTAAEKMYVGEINFEGNQTFKSSELQEFIRLKPAGFFQRRVFNSRTMKLDAISLESFYISQGFIHVRVTPETEPGRSNSVNITFNIVESQRYYIQRLDFSGNSVFSDQQIMQQLNAEPGMVYNPVQLSANLRRLQYEYSRRGKLKINLVDEVTLDEGSADIRLNIFEGLTYTIGRISVSGLEKYPEKFVFRDLDFSEGDVYDISRIEKSQRRVFSSQLFSSVEIYPKFPDADTSVVNIEIKVREYKNRSIQFDLGFSQESSSRGEGAPPATVFGLETRWQPGPLFRTGNQFEVGGKIGLMLDENISFPPRSLYVNWFAPRLLGKRIPLRIRYYLQEQRDEYTLLSHGFETSFLYKQGEYYKLIGGLNLEWIKVDKSAVDSSSTGSTQDFERSLELKFLKQKLDNIINPHNGYYFSCSAVLNGTFLGGEKDYLKLSGEYKEFRELRENLIFGTLFKSGYLYNFQPENSDDNLDIRDKFYLGGNTSLRGWRDVDDYNSEFGLDGGIAMLQANMEIRFPIIWWFGGEIFIDSGKLDDQISKDLLRKWSWDVGAGLTVETPIGPVRIDYAYPEARKTSPTVLISLLYMF